MTCYAVGQLRDIRMGPDIAAYLQSMDATLAPFDGAFIIHGGPKQILEGDSKDDLIVIAFPDKARARSWYDSAAYQAIKPLRTLNAEGEVFLIEGVGADHKATDILAG